MARRTAIPGTAPIDPARRRIDTRCIGPVTLAEVVEHFEEQNHNSDCPPVLDVMLDLREMTSRPDAACS